MTYSKFSKNSKYIYYCPEFDEIILGGYKTKSADVLFNRVKIATLVYIGDL